MKIKVLLLAALCGLLPTTKAATPTATPNDGSVLPFPPTPSASIAAPTLAESKMIRRAESHGASSQSPTRSIHSTLR